MSLEVAQVLNSTNHQRSTPAVIAFRVLAWRIMFLLSIDDRCDVKHMNFKQYL